MNEPKEIFAGDKLEWTESNSAYPASEGWVLKYVLINNSQKYTFQAAADGDNHKVTLLSTDTSAWAAGTYTLMPYYESSTTKEIQTRLTLKIKPNLITAATYDTRSHARKALEAIEAAIERRATKEQSALQISTPQGTRSLQWMSMRELIEAREFYNGELIREQQAERAAQGKAAGGRVFLEFQ